MDDEDTHQTNGKEANEHVHESSNWSPDELEDDDPENALAESCNESSFLSHVTFRETSVDGQSYKHSECCADSLEDGFNFVEMNDNRDEI